MKKRLPAPFPFFALALGVLGHASAAIQRALGEIDLLAAFTAQMGAVEFIRKNFLLLAAIGATAFK